MKRFLKKTFFFVAIIIISYPAFVWTAHIYDVKLRNYPKRIKESKNGYGFLANRLTEAEDIQNIDVLILGSSLAYRGIDTRSFDTLGLRAFNLGSSAQTPLQTEFLLDKFFDQLNPQLIIWDISPFLFSNPGFESFVDLVSNFGFNKSLIQQAFMIQELDAIHTLTFALIDDFIRPKNKNQLIERTDSEVYIKGGFAQTLKTKYERSRPLNEVKLEYISYQKEAFERVLEKLENKNLILVFAPIRSEDYELLVGVDDFQEYVYDKVEDLDKTLFYNFNEPILSEFESKSLFYDEFHLNENGVKIYNRKLVDYVFKNFSFNDCSN